MIEKIDIKKYCPDCGNKLKIKVLFNEEPYLQYGMYSCWTENGNKYDKETGERLYRTELYCPTLVKKCFREAKSHYNIRDKEYIKQSELQDLLPHKNN